MRLLGVLLLSVVIMFVLATQSAQISSQMGAVQWGSAFPAWPASLTPVYEHTAEAESEPILYAQLDLNYLYLRVATGSHDLDASAVPSPSVKQAFAISIGLAAPGVENGQLPPEAIVAWNPGARMYSSEGLVMLARPGNPDQLIPVTSGAPLVPYTGLGPAFTPPADSVWVRLVGAPEDEGSGVYLDIAIREGYLRDNTRLMAVSAWQFRVEQYSLSNQRRLVSSGWSHPVSLGH